MKVGSASFALFVITNYYFRVSYSTFVGTGSGTYSLLVSQKFFDCAHAFSVKKYFTNLLKDISPKLIPYFIPDGKSLYCPRDFTLLYPMCFWIRSTRMDWTEGEDYCNDLPGGHLVAIHTKEEFDFAVDMATSFSRF